MTRQLRAEEKLLRAWSALIVAAIAVVGHTFVVLAIYRERRLRTIPNFIILNLSVADFLFTVIVPPTHFVRLVRRQTSLTTAPCYITGVASMLFCLASINTLTFVSIERYMATNYPLKHRYRFTPKLIKNTLAIIWCWSALLSGIPFLTSKYVYMKRFFHCVPDWADDLATTLFFVVSGIILPEIVLVYCNTHVVIAIRKSRQVHANPLPSTTCNSLRQRYQRERKISRMMTVVVVMFAICWAPYSVAMVCLVTNKCHLPENIMALALILSTLNSGCNPIVYGLLNKKFRKAFKDILCNKKAHVVESTLSQPAS